MKFEITDKYQEEEKPIKVWLESCNDNVYLVANNAKILYLDASSKELCMWVLDEHELRNMGFKVVGNGHVRVRNLSQP